MIGLDKCKVYDIVCRSVVGGGHQYSEHARWQQRERSITDAEVEACLNDYDTRHTDKKGNPVYRAKLASGRGIKVVVAQDDDSLIITVADY